MKKFPIWRVWTSFVVVKDPQHCKNISTRKIFRTWDTNDSELKA
jgi:hypothetical protein